MGKALSTQSPLLHMTPFTMLALEIMGKDGICKGIFCLKHDGSNLVYTAKKPTIHQVTTMLATSKNVQFSGHNHLLTTGTDDPSLHSLALGR